MSRDYTVLNIGKGTCPICNADRKNSNTCKRWESGMISCYRETTNEVGEEINGYRFAGEDAAGFGSWKPADQWEDSATPKQSVKSPRKPQKRVWEYTRITDSTHSAEVKVTRIDSADGKKIFQKKIDNDLNVFDDLTDIYPALAPLYYGEVLKRALDGELVFLAEGEATADALRQVGLNGTTLNKNAPKDTLKVALIDRGVDASQIIVCPDQDKVGVKDAQKVAEVIPGCRFMHAFPGTPQWNGQMPDGGGLDAFDWIELGATAEQITAAVVDELVKITSKKTSDSSADAASLEEFQQWLQTLLEKDEWMRLPMAQKKAKEDGLAISARQIGELLKRAEHESRGISIKRRGRRSLKSVKIPALWEGMIPARRPCAVIGLPKSNKTQLILNMVAAWWGGEESYLGRKLNGECPPVIIVGTDQGEEDWVNSLRRAGLPGEVDPDMQITPIVELWSAEQGLALNAEGIEAVREVAEEYPGALIIADSIRKLVVSPLGIDEKDTRVVSPLQKLELELAPYDVSMVYIHHAGKGRAGESPITAGAGGTALPGHAANLIGLQKVSDRDDEHRVQVWIDGRLGRESKFYFDSSVDGFALLGDGQDIARVERMQKAEGALTDAQEEVLLGLREVFVAESLPATSEQLCYHLGGKYLKTDGCPYLQLMNSKLKSLANKSLISRSTESTKTGTIVLWTPVQLPSNQTYDPF